MAFSFSGGSSGLGRRRFGSSGAVISEINIVPLVDVVLVLLVIFMLTAQVMEFGLEINVPKTRDVRDSAEELPVVNIKKSGTVFLNDKEVNIHEIPAQVAKRFKGTKKVYVRADKDGIFDPVVQVISELGRAGLTPLIVTQSDTPSGKRR
jgi:biopolymer transport protein ExbD